MSRIANAPDRPYRSELRTEQAEATRSRILDAALRVMATGIASLSIPAVAREAGVSVPTVYRHFGTKRDLLAALYPHAAKRTGLDQVPDPTGLDDVRRWTRAMLGRLDSLDDVARANFASPIAAQTRQVTMPSRVERVRRFADSFAATLPEADRDRITRLVVVLTSSSSLRMWRDNLGASVDQVAEDLDWTLRAVVAAATSGQAR